jgi:hypothetical protein
MKQFVSLALLLAVSLIVVPQAVFGQEIARNSPPDLLARDNVAPAASPSEAQTHPTPSLGNFVTVSATESTSVSSASASTNTAETLMFTPVMRPVEQKPVFHKKIFITELAAYTVSNIVDGITTVRGVRRGFTESSWPRGSAELLGLRPGIARYTATMGALELGAAFASYRLQHSQNRYLRMLGHSLMLEGTVEHTMGFANNLRLPSQP